MIVKEKIPSRFEEHTLQFTLKIALNIEMQSNLFKLCQRSGDTDFSPFIKKYFAKYVDCLRLPDISSERLCKQQLNSSINSFSFIAFFFIYNFSEMAFIAF